MAARTLTDQERLAHIERLLQDLLRQVTYLKQRAKRTT